jgi:dipeptidase D
MDRKLSGLQPEIVFRHFESLTRIPRESGNEKAVADFLVAFAENLGLEVIREDCGNVIINKPGTPGHEKGPRVILQGHTDMVCVKHEGLDFDFSTDPIPLVVEGDFVKTEGTTLGADNGIAVAMTMSILESEDLEHPPITALFTVAEETGMDGVLALDPAHVEGDILINLDSEEEGTLLASCAGGVNHILSYTYRTEDTSDRLGRKLVCHGLKGGHSGIEIDRMRANALKLMGRVLTAIGDTPGIGLARIEGGEKMNAIPSRAEMTLAVAPDSLEKLEKLIGKCQETFRKEFALSDPAITLDLVTVDAPERMLRHDDRRAVERILRLTPTGVQTMSAGIEGLVESSNNLGVLEQNENMLVFTNAIRSSVRSLKVEITERIALIAESVGADHRLTADYPEWSFEKDSPIRELMKEVYRDSHGSELQVDAIHAGLECGFLKEKLGDIDMVSLGPNLYDVHTPEEKLSIASTERVYRFLCDVLARL